MPTLKEKKNGGDILGSHTGIPSKLKLCSSKGLKIWAFKCSTTEKSIYLIH